MKAPKLLLALGLSAPILVQALSHHQHGHSDLAESALNSHHDEHAPTRELDSGDSGTHGEARDADFDHGDNDELHSMIPPSMPSFPPSPASLEERDTVDEDELHIDDPTKKRCNPFAPFCSHCASKAQSSEEQDKVHKKRELDTRGNFEGCQAEQPQEPDNPPEFNKTASNILPDTATDIDDDERIFEDLIDDFIDVFLDLQEIWEDASEGNVKRDDTSDATGTPEDPEALTSSLVRLKLLASACESGRLCACNLIQRPSPPDNSTLTSREMLNCVSDGKIHFDDEAKADTELICMIAAGGCIQEGGCACRLQDKCKSDSGPGPTWHELFDCASSDNGHHDSQHQQRAASDDDKSDDVAKRDEEDGIDGVRKACERAKRDCSKGSHCGCYYSRRCLVEGLPSGWDLKMMRRCLAAGGRNIPRDDSFPDEDSAFSFSKGAATTINIMGTTMALSVSKTSPTVNVVTGGRSNLLHSTFVESIVSTDPTVYAMTGFANDEWIDTTTTVTGAQLQLNTYVGLEQRNVQSSPTDPPSLDGYSIGTHTQSYAASMASPLRKRDADDSTTESAAASTSTTTLAVAGNNSAPYFQATDAEGRPIYVTRAGDFAADTTTLNFSASARPATTTRQGEIVEYRVITTTETKTKTVPVRCTPFKTQIRADKTVMDLGSTEIPITNAVQTVNGTAMYFAHPQATLTPLVWKEAFAVGFEHMFGMDPDMVMEMFSDDDLDWQSIREMSVKLREVDGEMVPALSFQKALIMHLRSMRGEPAPYAEITPVNKDNVKHYFDGPTILELPGGLATMANATQTNGGLTLVMDPLAQYQNYDARYHRVVPTPACVKDQGVFKLFNGWGKEECMVERCMWDHMKPIDIQTVFPAAMHDGCGQMYDYFTQRTRLEDPHWGTSVAGGEYYPVVWQRASKTVTSTSSGTVQVIISPTCSLKRQVPDTLNQRDASNLNVHGDPDCSDMESCHDWCKIHHGGIPHGLMLALMIALPLCIGIPLLALLFCCLRVYLLHRHRRMKAQKQNADNNAANANAEKERRPSVMDKLRRKSGAQQGAVVNSANGQAIDPATGRPVEGGSGAASNVASGPAAGAAAARAESGQGQGGAGGGQGGAGGAGGGSGGQAAGGGAGGAGGQGGGSGGSAAGGGSNSGGAGGGAAGGQSGAGSGAAGGQQSSSKTAGGSSSDDGKGTLGRQAEEGRSRVHFDEAPKPVPEGEPHVEAKTDGTIESASGREWADVGSMRGRKRARGEGPVNGLNLGF